jgi:serine protease Do
MSDRKPGHRPRALLSAVLLAGVAASAPGAAMRVEVEARQGRSLFPGLVAFDEQLETLARQVSPSVVQVIASGYTTGSGSLLSRARASGSGVIVDGEGWIVTNTHVVEGARAVQVDLLRPRLSSAGGSILPPGSRRVRAQVVGADRETDIAVLRVEEDGLPALEMGDSDDLRQGQLVLAFGSPLGLENSASLGVVSSVARQLEPEAPMIYVQTDASINPGNSGGPLVDVRGRMVGLNTLIASQSGGNEGIGFAAPSNIVRAVFEQIRDRGRVRRGIIGVKAQTITPALAAGLRLGVGEGVVLSDVVPSGPAALAGLHICDVVLALDGKPMENARQLDVNLYRRAPGDTVTLTVIRDGGRRDVAVDVVERPRDPDRFLSLVTPERNLIPRLGILALELDSVLARAVGPLRGNEGVLVAGRASAGPTTDDSLQVGDVIYAVNGVSVRGLAELRSAVTAPRPGEPLVLQVERSGTLLYVVVEVE